MLSPIEVESIFNPVFITATNMVIPIETISILTIKNNLETIIMTIIDTTISYSTLAIILTVYSLYKLKKII